MSGPLALVGSGEFLAAMRDVDARLLDGRTRRVAVIPTAAAPEGEAVTRRWFDLAHVHYRDLEAEVVEVDVRTREDAEDPRWEEALDDVGLIYLSGGNPMFLAATLHQTPLWHAITTAWTEGAALAGCSAGAMVFGERIPALPWRRHDESSHGLDLLAATAVLPHFDAFVRRFGRLSRFSVDGHVDHLLGIDEDTALVHDPDTDRWRVEGAAGAWRISGDGVDALDLDGFDIRPRLAR